MQAWGRNKGNNVHHQSTATSFSKIKAKCLPEQRRERLEKEFIGETETERADQIKCQDHFIRGMGREIENV